MDVVALTSLGKVARMFATAKWIANVGRESLRPEIKDEGQGAESFYPDAAFHAPRTHASELLHTLILVQENTTDGAGHVISLPHRANLRTALAHSDARNSSLARAMSLPSFSRSREKRSEGSCAFAWVLKDLCWPSCTSTVG